MGDVRQQLADLLADATDVIIRSANTGNVVTSDLHSKTADEMRRSRFCLVSVRTLRTRFSCLSFHNNQASTLFLGLHTSVRRKKSLFTGRALILKEGVLFARLFWISDSRSMLTYSGYWRV